MIDGQGGRATPQRGHVLPTRTHALKHTRTFTVTITRMSQHSRVVTRSEEATEIRCLLLYLQKKQRINLTPQPPPHTPAHTPLLLPTPATYANPSTHLPHCDLLLSLPLRARGLPDPLADPSGCRAPGAVSQTWPQVIFPWIALSILSSVDERADPDRAEAG